MSKIRKKFKIAKKGAFDVPKSCGRPHSEKGATGISRNRTPLAHRSGTFFGRLFRADSTLRPEKPHPGRRSLRGNVYFPRRAVDAFGRMRLRESVSGRPFGE